MAFSHDAELNVAIAAVDAAVAVLAAEAGAFATLSSDGRDIKSEADLQAESAMLDVIRGNSDIPVLSEEAGADDTAARAEAIWVVDPLDGTMNFMRGLPACCTCAALVVNGHPVLGVVHDLVHDERWLGGTNLPTTCNGNPVQASACASLDQAVLSTGFPRTFEFTAEAMDLFTRRMASVKKVRMIGAAAMSLAWASGGRVDLHAESRTFLWDIAAGVALVEGAGGAVLMSNVDEQWRCDVIAGAPALVSLF